MIYGFIIAAGKQTRFEDEKPKAIVDINGISCLDINIHGLGSVCDSVIVVCSKENEKYFEDYTRIVIDSGLGCGDAIFNALRQFDFSDEDTCFIQWGDCFVDNPKLYKLIKNRYHSKNIVVIPCNYEYEPYVKLEQYYDSIKVSFSKYDEVEKGDCGFHDMSIFYGNINKIKHYCFDFYCSYFEHSLSTLSKSYECSHGKEFNFLDLFNFTDIKGDMFPINSNKYKCYAFNTIEEYDNIINEIGGNIWI